jgi:hypothetical protein
MVDVKRAVHSCMRAEGAVMSPPTRGLVREVPMVGFQKPFGVTLSSCERSRYKVSAAAVARLSISLPRTLCAQCDPYRTD